MTRCRPTTPGQNAKTHGHREDQEDDRDHHQDLLAGAGLDQRAAAGLADVGGLGVQHVGQRGAALDRDRDALRRTARPRGSPVRRGQRVEGAARPASPVRTSASTRAEVGGELAAAAAYDPVERGDRALAGGDGERQQLGDGRELGEDPALALA